MAALPRAPQLVLDVVSIISNFSIYRTDENIYIELSMYRVERDFPPWPWHPPVFFMRMLNEIFNVRTYQIWRSHRLVFMFIGFSYQGIDYQVVFFVYRYRVVFDFSSSDTRH